MLRVAPQLSDHVRRGVLDHANGTGRLVLEFIRIVLSLTEARQNSVDLRIDWRAFLHHRVSPLRARRAMYREVYARRGTDDHDVDEDEYVSDEQDDEHQ